MSVNKGNLFMSITKQRWQLTRCDSTLEHFSSTQIKLLHLELEHTSAELLNFKKHTPYSLSLKQRCVCRTPTFEMAWLKIRI